MRLKLNAFTTSDFIIYLAIVSVFLIVVASFWSALVEQRLKGDAINLVNNEGSMIMAEITNSIHNATAIISPVNGSSSHSISLVMKEAEKNPTTISFSAGQLLFQEGNKPAINLTTNKIQLDEISFNNLSKSGENPAIRIEFQISSKNNSNNKNIYYSQKFFNTGVIRK